MSGYDSWKTRSPDDGQYDPNLDDPPSREQQEADYLDEQAQFEKEGMDRALDWVRDWPPMASAIGLPEGERRHGSTGQLFEVKNGRWERVR